MMGVQALLFTIALGSTEQTAKRHRVPVSRKYTPPKDVDSNAWGFGWFSNGGMARDNAPPAPAGPATTEALKDYDSTSGFAHNRKFYPSDGEEPVKHGKLSRQGPLPEEPKEAVGSTDHASWASHGGISRDTVQFPAMEGDLAREVSSTGRVQPFARDSETGAGMFDPVTGEAMVDLGPPMTEEELQAEREAELEWELEEELDDKLEVKLEKEFEAGLESKEQLEALLEEEKVEEALEQKLEAELMDEAPGGATYLAALDSKAKKLTGAELLALKYQEPVGTVMHLSDLPVAHGVLIHERPEPVAAVGGNIAYMSDHPTSDRPVISA